MDHRDHLDGQKLLKLQKEPLQDTMTRTEGSTAYCSVTSVVHGN